MAINPKLCLTEEEWLILFGQILTTPTPQALLKAGIYFDFRSLFGKHELVRKLRKRLIEHSPRSRLFLKLMSENDLDAGRPPVHQLDWKIRRLLGFGNLSVDLKLQALRPLVMGIRTLALSAGIEESHSLERYRYGYRGTAMDTSRVGKKVSPPPRLRNNCRPKSDLH